jgi:predicted 3-demethylubiquinone-9 3-methyltransferase (glyoxalase superfamily)
MPQKKIATCLWFDDQGEEAARFYTSLFGGKIGKIARYGAAGSKMAHRKEGSVMTVEFDLAGLPVVALNGGPLFKHSPALSFFVSTADEAELDTLWKKLSEGGKVRMGLDKYPWSAKYGWTADKYGVEWQVILAPAEQKVVPGFLFVKDVFGKGEEAMNYYMSLFEGSKVKAVSKDPAHGTILHARFSLGEQELVLMEGPGDEHNYGFTHAFSFMVPVDSQAECDRFWAKLSAGGNEEPCGWVKDKYGVSWQVVPSQMGKWMTDPKRAEAVMSTLLQMKKLDIGKLQAAFERG